MENTKAKVVLLFGNPENEDETPNIISKMYGSDFMYYDEVIDMNDYIHTSHLNRYRGYGKLMVAFAEFHEAYKNIITVDKAQNSSRNIVITTNFHKIIKDIVGQGNNRNFKDIISLCYRLMKSDDHIRPEDIIYISDNTELDIFMSTCLFEAQNGDVKVIRSENIDKYYE